MDASCRHLDETNGYKVGDKVVVIVKPESRPVVRVIEDIVERCRSIYMKFKNDYENQNVEDGYGVDKGYILVYRADWNFYYNNIMKLEPSECELRYNPDITFVQRLAKRKRSNADYEWRRARGRGIQQAYSYYQMHWSSY